MTISESQRRTLDLMAESAGWGWADVEELAYQMYRTTVSGLTKGQANKVMQVIAEWMEADGDHGGGPCDYVERRDILNAQDCSRCGAPAWDICYDVFLCDKHVAIIDAGYNEHQRREQERRHALPA